MKKRWFLLCCAAFFSTFALALVLKRSYFRREAVPCRSGDENCLSLPALLSSDMIFQRMKPIHLWGRASLGKEVFGTLNGVTKQASRAGALWRVEFPPLPAGGPYQITIRAGEQSVVLKNILVGDVFLIAGQSNACFPVRESHEAQMDLLTANNAQLRLFSQRDASAEVPQEDVVSGHWQVASPASVKHFSAIGYFMGQRLQTALGIPIGLIQACKGDTNIQEWISREALEGIAYDFSINPADHPPTKLYNAMVAPLAAFSIRGVVWYQGESNLSAKSYYERLLATYIDSYRKKLRDPNLPFLIVQLPGYDDSYALNWPYLRQAQLAATTKIPHTGLVVTFDIDDKKNIHPAKKKPVADRLALLAQSMIYQTGTTGFSPSVRAQQIEGSAIRLSFDHVGSGLWFKPGVVLEIEIADKSRRFVKAQASVVSVDEILVWSDKVALPRYVRYAWSNAPVASLFNGNGLPASPFCTD